MSIKCTLGHIKLAKKNQYKLEYQRACCNLGNALLDKSEQYLENNRNDKFLKYNNKSIRYLREAEVSAQKILNLSKHAQFEKNEDWLFDALSAKDYETLVIEAMLNKANAYHVRGRYDDKYYNIAQELLQRVLSMASEAKNSILKGKAYFTIGAIHMKLKQFDESLSYFERDAMICEMNREFAGLSKTLRELGKLHLFRRDYDKSKELLVKALRTVQQHFPRNTVEAQNIKEDLENLALEVHSLKKLDEILKSTAKMEETQKELKEVWLFQIMEALEIALDKIEYPERSAEIARGALDLINKNRVGSFPKLDYYVSKLNYFLALSMHKLKKYEESKQAYLQTLEFERQRFEKEKCEDYPVTLIDYGNMLDESDKEFEESQRIYDEAFKHAKECNNKRIQLIALNNLEALYKTTKKKTELREIQNVIAKFVSKNSQDCESSFEMGSDVEFEDSDTTMQVERVHEDPIFKPSRADLIENEDDVIPVRKPKFKPRDRRKLRLPENEDDENIYNTHQKEKHKKSARAESQSMIQNLPKPNYLPKEFVNLTLQQQRQNLFNKLCKKHLVPCNDKFFAKLTQNELDLKNCAFQEDAVRIALKVATLNRELRVINLEGNRLGVRGLKTLINLITIKRSELCRSLTMLSLSKNPVRMGNLTSERHKFSSLLPALSLLKFLEHLDLSYIQFSTSEKGLLFEKTEHLKELKILKLKGCDLDSFEIKAIPRSLQLLDLSCNHLNWQTLKDLFFSEKVDSVTTLDLSAMQYPSKQDSYYQGTSNCMDIDKRVDDLLTTKFLKVRNLKLKNLDFNSLIPLICEERFSAMLASIEVLDLSGSTSGDVVFNNSNRYFFTNKFSGCRVLMNIRKFKYQKGDFTDPQMALALRRFVLSLENVEKIDVSFSRFHDDVFEKLPNDLEMFTLLLRKVDVRGVHLTHNFSLRVQSSFPKILLLED